MTSNNIPEELPKKPYPKTRLEMALEIEAEKIQDKYAVSMTVAKIIMMKGITIYQDQSLQNRNII